MRCAQLHCEACSHARSVATRRATNAKEERWLTPWLTPWLMASPLSGQVSGGESLLLDWGGGVHPQVV